MKSQVETIRSWDHILTVGILRQQIFNFHICQCFQWITQYAMGNKTFKNPDLVCISGVISWCLVEKKKVPSCHVPSRFDQNRFSEKNHWWQPSTRPPPSGAAPPWLFPWHADLDTMVGVATVVRSDHFHIRSAIDLHLHYITSYYIIYIIISYLLKTYM